MPKTRSELSTLKSMVAEREQRGALWLGAHWRPDLREWAWDDGEALGDLASDLPEPEEGVRRWLSLNDGRLQSSEGGQALTVPCEDAHEEGKHISHERRRPWQGEPRRMRLTLQGYSAGPRQARKACMRSGKRLMRAKTAAERAALVAFIEKVVGRGRMTKFWLEKAAWVAGRYSRSADAWVWDDGDRAEGLPWAHGRPGAPGREEERPWLAMAGDGHFLDTSALQPPFIFAVVCEERRGIVGLAKKRGRLVAGWSGLPWAVLPALAATCLLALVVLAGLRRRRLRAAGNSRALLLDGGGSSSSDLEDWPPWRKLLSER